MVQALVSPTTGAQQQQQATARPPPPNRTETHISEISDSQVPTANRTVGTTTTAQRGRNYTAAECCMLANAYLKVSTNAAVGTNQTDNTFWEDVAHNYGLLVDQVYQTNRDKQYSHRTSSQLQSAWKRMQRSINKFIAICRQNPRGSGDRDDDLYYKRVRVLYDKQNKSKFSDAYLAAHKYLQEQPKWTEENSETVGNGINEKDANSLSTPAASSKKRPPGRDSTKMERNVKRASTAVAKNISAAVEENTKALLQKLLPEIAKAREAQEAASTNDMLKYASPDMQKAYADKMVNQMMLKADAEGIRTELQLIQLKKALANAKEEQTMTNGEDEASKVREDEQRVDQEDERVEQEHREGSPKNDDEMQDEEDDGWEPQQDIPIDADNAQAAVDNDNGPEDNEERSDGQIGDDDIINVDDSDDEEEDEPSDPDEIAEVFAAATFTGPVTVPVCKCLRPKYGQDLFLEDFQSEELDEDVRNAAVVTNFDDLMKACDLRTSHKFVMKVSKYAGLGFRTKPYDFTEWEAEGNKVPEALSAFIEYADANPSNAQEVMAFNYVCEFLLRKYDRSESSIF